MKMILMLIWLAFDWWRHQMQMQHKNQSYLVNLTCVLWACIWFTFCGRCRLCKRADLHIEGRWCKRIIAGLKSVSASSWLVFIGCLIEVGWRHAMTELSKNLQRIPWRMRGLAVSVQVRIRVGLGLGQGLPNPWWRHNCPVWLFDVLNTW